VRGYVPTARSERWKGLPRVPVILQTTLLLALSNLFMLFAWYAHLRNLSARPW
jgi:uncharacterized protein (DUF486 family)